MSIFSFHNNVENSFFIYFFTPKIERCFGEPLRSDGICFYENEITRSGVEKFLFMRQFFIASFYFYIFILLISKDFILFDGMG